MIGYRHVDRRFPFLWEDEGQPPGRWHSEGEGPVHYFADTADGAWAEFLRHEEIRDREDLPTIRRALWAVDLGEPPAEKPALPARTLIDAPRSYAVCQRESRRLRRRGALGAVAPSAALLAGGARGHRTHRGLQPGPYRDGRVVVLFGPRPDLVGWCATAAGRPREDLLPRVRHYRRR